MKISQKRSPLTTVAKGAAVVAAGAALAFANTTPAAAHGGHWVYLYASGGFMVGSGQWTNDTITYCDKRVDGNRVRLQLLQYDGSVSYSGWAPSLNNSPDGCNYERGRTGYQFRVCAENVGCTSWHNRY